MAARVRIILDDVTAQASLTALERKLSPVGLSAYFVSRLEPWITRRAADRFGSEGDDASGAWDPLKVSTAAIRESLGYEGHHPINIRSGELEDYIVGASGSVASSGSVTIWTYPSSEPVGEMARKVKTAQTGNTTEFPQPVPPRPVLAVGARDLAFLQSSLAQYIQEGI